MRAAQPNPADVRYDAPAGLQEPHITETVPTEPRPFRFPFALLYAAITGAVAYVNGLALCRNYILIEGDATFGLGLLLILLLGAEWLERTKLDNHPPVWLSLLLLLGRMGLLEGVVALDCTSASIFLYPMIPYYVYFSFGGTASLLAGLFYVAVVIARLANQNAFWYQDPTTLSNLIGFILVMLFVPVIGLVVRRDESNRRRTEKLLSDLRVSNLKLQAYANQVAELAAVEERNRLARDIHDSVGHYLTAVSIQLEKALAYHDRDPAEAIQAVLEAKQAASQALADVRQSVGALRDPESDFSLEEALSDLVKTVDRSRIRLDFRFEGDEKGYSRAVLLVLYRTAQEGLTNIQRHAQANTVTLNVSLGESQAHLLLRDNGQGFDPADLNDTLEGEQSFGLRGIRERIEMVRGRLTLMSRPQQGTELAITIPKQWMKQEIP